VSGTVITDPELASLQQQLTQDQNQLADLNNKLDSVRFDAAAASNGVANIFIVRDAPQVPLTTTLQKKKLLVYTGGGFGIAVAIIALIVGLQTFLDRKIYSPVDIRTILDDLELDVPSVEAVPLLREPDYRSSDTSDNPFGIDGVLVPVLTALPQLSGGAMTDEIRQAIGTSTDQAQ
jgi:hypothetical protein